MSKTAAEIGIGTRVRVRWFTINHIDLRGEGSMVGTLHCVDGVVADFFVDGVPSTRGMFVRVEPNTGEPPVTVSAAAIVEVL